MEKRILSMPFLENIYAKSRYCLFIAFFSLHLFTFVFSTPASATAAQQREIVIHPLLISSARSETTESEVFMARLRDLQEVLSQAARDNPAISPFTLFSASCDYPDDYGTDGVILREQAQIEGKARGLELRGALSTGSLDGSDNDAGLERGRGNVELSWDLLSGGYLQSKSRSATLKVRAREADLLQEFVELQREYRCRQLAIRRFFGSRQMQALDKQMQFLQAVYTIERRAYFRQWSFLDDYLVSEQDLVLAREDFMHLATDPFLDQVVPSWSLPPLINVDLAALVERIEHDPLQNDLLQTQKTLIEAEDRDIWHDKFRVYLRQEMGIDGDEENETIAGLRFRIPLHSRQDEVKQLEHQRLEKRGQARLWDRVATTRIVYGELREQLKRTLRQHYRHQRADERFRRTMSLLTHKDERLLTAAITRMKTWMEARLELIGAIEVLYSKVNRVLATARVPFTADLISVVSLLPHLDRARYGHRSLYLWSDAFHDLENNDIAAFLEAKNITTLLLSTGKNGDRIKQRQLIRLLATKGIEVTPIRGDNSWLFPDKQLAAVEKIVIAAELTGRVHLDIEPHTLPDYAANKKSYLSTYLELIGLVKERLLDRELSLAVPFHWPDEVFRSLGETADGLYLMAYGTIKAQTMIRRIKRVLAVVPRDKLTVVLNAKEFPDEWAMEQMVNAIAAETGISHFGIHHFDRYLQIAARPYETEN